MKRLLLAASVCLLPAMPASAAIVFGPGDVYEAAFTFTPPRGDYTRIGVSLSFDNPTFEAGETLTMDILDLFGTPYARIGGDAMGPAPLGAHYIFRDPLNTPWELSNIFRVTAGPTSDFTLTGLIITPNTPPMEMFDDLGNPFMFPIYGDSIDLMPLLQRQGATVIPLPAAGWLLLGALGALAALGRRRA